jgi:hypothetical protein
MELEGVNNADLTPVGADLLVVNRVIVCVPHHGS